ncbi:MAG TPA: T9SS type A sorting domain-containing protein [Bacteroidota bacterium]|nr:T9SS type A sorting domain-containing protein [Bacteroidota bacterium]
MTVRSFAAMRSIGVAVSLLAGVAARGQVTQVLPVDLLAGIRDGSVHLNVVPQAANDSLNPFDRNPNSDLLITGSDSLVVTLRFDTPVQIQASRVFMMSNGSWTLEAASSLGDLNAKSGSYALLAPPRPFVYRVWDSVAFAPGAYSCVRLRARDTVYSYFDLGEWTLMNAVTYTKLAVSPSPVKLIPGGTLRLRVWLVDDHDRILPYTLGYPFQWSTDAGSVASVDQNGFVTGVAPGVTKLTVATEPAYIAGSAPVSVLADFTGEKSPPVTAKVALVLLDPVLPQYGYERLHVKYGFRDPVAMANALVKYFAGASDSTVNFVIALTLDCTRTFTAFRGGYLTFADYQTYLSQPGWPTLKAAQDSLKFDYRALVNYYHLDSLRNAGVIDEVWVYAGPYMGMYESQLMGPDAFWWNSPPIKDGTGLTKLLSVMGLNYERGVDLAYHSFGHRFESAMVQAYSQVQGRPWNDTSANPTPWDLFTRINRDVPGGAHVGNVHFPPNGASDYDYGNTTIVTSYAQNWFRYPYLFQQHAQVNVATWIYKTPEPLAEGLDQLGYLYWFYDHMPRYRGITDGILNNWWLYFLDYDAAITLAAGTPPLGVRGGLSPVPGPDYRLGQNYPNPFNPATTITFNLPSRGAVSLAVYDVLGRRVATLVDGNLPAGAHTAVWDGRSCATGVYFYRLRAEGFAQTKKMLLLR